MALSPYEENILDFIYLVQTKPELFTTEDRTDFAKLVATLPEDVEEITNALSLWCESHPHILDAFLTLSSESLR